MVLPKDELGSNARKLERDEDSGPTDNAAAADDTIDPKDTARDLRRAGRIQGYDLYYSDFDVFVNDKDGLGVVGTSVELFRDARSARRYMTKQVDAYDDAIGTKEDEILLRRVRHFAVRDLGEQQAGVELELEYEKEAARFWIVAFRIDRVVATAGVFRTDRVSAREYAQEIARALRARIERVAAKAS